MPPKIGPHAYCDQPFMKAADLARTGSPLPALDHSMCETGGPGCSKFRSVIQQLLTKAVLGHEEALSVGADPLLTAPMK
jgi:hypothetical protein